MHWQLWETESNNLVETFDTEDEALQGVRDLLAVNRPDYIEFLTLGAWYDEGEPHDVELPPVLDGDTLRARLAETAPDPARAVHEQIRRWLAEEGWAIEDTPDPQNIFDVMITLQNGKPMNVFQRRESSDCISVGLNIVFDDTNLNRFNDLPRSAQQTILDEIERDAMIMGVEFEMNQTPIIEMLFSSSIYFDGLTKDRFIRTVLLVVRAISLSVRTITRGLESPDHPEEAHSKLLHLVPRARDSRGVWGLLTSAS
jgi:hypothetical protein